MSISETARLSNNRTAPGGDLAIEIGKRLRALRVQRDRTQQWLADQMGITFQQIQKYEHGTNNISIPRLFEICVIFQVDWSHFFDPISFPQRELANLFRNRTTLELVDAFEKITEGKDRRTIVSFVQMFGEKLA